MANEDTDKPVRNNLLDMLDRINPNSPYYLDKIDLDKIEDSPQSLHKINAHRPRFALFLGAGASVESFVPSAKVMTDDFVDRICRVNCPSAGDSAREEWIKENILKTVDEKKTYSYLFEYCFPQAVDRREYIEKQVDGKSPSIGYYLLAHLFELNIFDTVITTNFDDLVYIACTTSGKKRPIVFSLGGFASEIASITNRPRVLKIHGDFLFSDIKNTDPEISDQELNMVQQVQQILETYNGLIVIGYSGNDTTVLDILRKIPKGKYLYWCVYGDETLNQDVNDLIENKGGCIVRTEGFDSLMKEIVAKSSIEPRDIIQITRGKLDEITKIFEQHYPEESLVVEANTRTEQRRTAEAMKVENPLDAESWYQYAKQLAKQPDKFLEANQAFEESIKLNNKNIYFYVSYFKFLAENAKIDEARKIYEQAVSQSPKNADIHIQFANSLADYREFYSEAENIYLNAKKIDPKNVSSYIGLLYLYDKKGEELKKAEEIYREATDYNPFNADIYKKFAGILLKKNQLTKAEEVYREALSYINDNSQLFVYFANFLLNKNNLDEAKELYKKAILLNPRYITPYYKIGIIMIKEDNPEALKYILDITKQFPDVKNNYFLLATCYKKQDETEETEKVIDKLRNFETNDDYDLACIESLSGNKAKALRYLGISIGKYPGKKEIAKIDPALDWVRDEPSFAEMMK